MTLQSRNDPAGMAEVGHLMQQDGLTFDEVSLRQWYWDLVTKGDRGKMEIRKVKNRIFLAGLQASLVFWFLRKFCQKS